MNSKEIERQIILRYLLGEVIVANGGFRGMIGCDLDKWGFKDEQ